MSERAGLGERLRYQFDKSMAAGPIALIGYLALISLVVVVLFGLILWVTGIGPEEGQHFSFLEGAWQSLMRTFDPGTMGGDAGWPLRLNNLLITIFGLLVVAALIGIISTGLDAKLDELRKGRSRVLEDGHTVILNWSASIFDIISELQIANASQRKARIVIMADKDKVEMEDEVKTKVNRAKNMQIICRSGKPTDLYDLNLVNAQQSKSIIIVSPEEDDPDAQVIKTVLAIVNDPNRRTEKYQIAAEIRDTKNAEVARVVGGEEVQLVLADELISRIVVHTSRQSGLSAVYSELLDFDGCEIYTTPQAELVGKPFGEAALQYETSTLIGICDENRKVTLNPAPDFVIPPNSRAIVIAEDDSSIRLAPGTVRIEEGRIHGVQETDKTAERVLILGWNRRAPVIAFELSRYVAPGSLLTVAAMADTPNIEDELSNLQVSGDNLKVETHVVDTTQRSALDALNPASYDSVMVLGYTDHLPAENADTRTLVTLLHLRQIAEAADHKIKVVSEMANVRNRELAEVTRADDFVVSNKLVSLMLAQASENEYIEAIFADLLDEEGSEIYMRKVEDYVDITSPVNFYTIAEACRRRGEVAVGYNRPRTGQAADPRNMGGVVVNPTKSEAIDYVAGDRIIVLAED